MDMQTLKSFERRWALLDAFIIEEIKRREQEREREENRPRLDLPLPMPSRPHRQNDERQDEDDEDGPQRGVVIIDYSVPAA